MAVNWDAGSQFRRDPEWDTSHSGAAGTRRYTKEAATQNLGSEPINGAQYYYKKPSGETTNLGLEFFGLFHKDPKAPTIISQYIPKNSTVSNVDTEVPGGSKQIAPTPTISAEG